MPRVNTLFAAVLLGSSVVLAQAPLRADELDKPTQDALKSVITQQLTALGKDDPTTAESFAAPGIKAKFPNPQDFLAMVRNSYAPLIRPRSTHFDEADTTAMGPLQKVTIVDSEGGAWTAVYSFEKVDGEWRISGCALVKEQSTTI